MSDCLYICVTSCVSCLGHSPCHALHCRRLSPHLGVIGAKRATVRRFILYSGEFSTCVVGSSLHLSVVSNHNRIHRGAPLAFLAMPNGMVVKEYSSRLCDDIMIRLSAVVLPSGAVCASISCAFNVIVVAACLRSHHTSLIVESAGCILCEPSIDYGRFPWDARVKMLEVKRRWGLRNCKVGGYMLMNRGFRPYLCFGACGG